MSDYWSPETNQFRGEVRNFLERELPAQLSRKVLAHEPLQKDDYVQWQKILQKKGWLAYPWPVSYGGTGWTPMQMHVFEEEAWLAGAPELLAFGFKMLAPVLMNYGNEQQKRYYLPRILDSEDWWCQGYSEPGSGSDLASLKTTARLDGDHYIVNGQKTWTTLGQYANRIFCLVRTNQNVRAQEGISFILIDMDSPGVTVRPIILMDGMHEVNEVFFDDVRVPIANLVGEPDKGWTYAKSLLGHERLHAGKLGRSKREMRLLKGMASISVDGGPPLIQDPRFAQRMAQAEVDLFAVENLALRLIAEAQSGHEIGAAASILKMRGTEIAQELSQLLLDALGTNVVGAPDQPSAAGLPTPGALVRQYCNWRKLSIYGGSNEIQHNIIAKTVLGL